MNAFEQDLAVAVAGQVACDQVTCGLYATDASHYQIVPRAVVAPRDANDCLAALEVAWRHRVPTTVRGAGTSLSGQTQGPGMVLDLSRRLNRVLEINAEEGWARVEPGVVRDQLNEEASQFGLHFAPDPATSSRACVGGMLGNNASGTRSIRDGKTSDHVLSCRLALADGQVVELGPLASDAWGNDRQGELYRGLRAIVEANRSEIAARFPKVMRQVSGYALDAFLSDPTVEPWNLARLLCGAEGTLGVVLEAKLRLVPVPGATAICAVHFDELLASLRAVEPILAHGPSAVELLDRDLMREAATSAATRELCQAVEGDPAAVLLVEVIADDQAGAQEQAEHLATALRSAEIGRAHPVFCEPDDVAQIWDMRRLGLGLLSNAPGRRKPQAFVEDACVPVEHLAEYIERLSQVCREHEVPFSMYAHASVGVIHLRPKLDLHDPAEVAKMQAIAEQAFELVVGYGGAFSGEHGDGLVRGQFIERFFGPQIYQAFREVKELFDPLGLMNPGKLIDPPAMTSHLRYQVPRYVETTQASDQQALFQFRDQGGLTMAVEQCNGVAACRQVGTGTMCPSYMATRDEKDSTRGRANALRLAISGQLDSDVSTALASEGLHEVMKLCLGCKACKAECPNAVDVAKMKSEVLQHRYDRRGTPLAAWAIGSLPIYAAQFTGFWSPFSNAMLRCLPVRWAMEKLVGIDRRRRLPRFARRSLEAQLRDGEIQLGSGREVVLYVDSYTNAYQVEIGRQAIRLLVDCGYQVTPALVGDSQRARISQGLLHAARRDGTRLLRRLDEYAARGLPILCLEPSCASALVDDLPDLSDDVELGRRVASWVQTIEDFLCAEGVRLRPRYQYKNLWIHPHCHQRATWGAKSMAALLPMATLLDAGCCGMAGAFGYEHAEVSRQVAEDRLLPALRAAGPSATIVASGFSCRHQIYEHLGVMPKHFVEVVEPA